MQHVACGPGFITGLSVLRGIDAEGQPCRVEPGERPFGGSNWRRCGTANFPDSLSRQQGCVQKAHSIHAAKTQLSRLLERAEKREEVIIARGSTPVARLTRLRPARPMRCFGAMRGHARVTRAFFESLPERELRRWE